jgi:assimilatory nitrate reductase catalytic subunit
VFRAAALAGGELVGVLALGPSQHLPPREWLGALMAAGPLAAGDRAALLVGRRADGPAPSPLVCACHGVSAAAIQGCGAADVDGVGAATRAGTGCGSCKPEIAALLSKVEA